MTKKGQNVVDADLLLYFSVNLYYIGRFVQLMFFSPYPEVSEGETGSPNDQHILPKTWFYQRNAMMVL
jgi:hypothetical protein